MTKSSFHMNPEDLSIATVKKFLNWFIARMRWVPITEKHLLNQKKVLYYDIIFSVIGTEHEHL